MMTIDYSEKIDRYLDGQMSQDELSWFKKEQDQNPDLRRDLEFQQNMRAAILEDEVLQFRQVLEAAQADYEHNKVIEHPSRGKFSKTFRIVAAIAAILVATGFFAWYTLHGGMSNRQLYEMYFKPYKVSMNVRGVADDTQAEIRKALSMYENGNYQQALPLFENVLKNSPANFAVNLYTGISLMELQQYSSATESFAKIIEHKNNLYFEQAEWYASLCYLVADQTDKARKQFVKIVERNGYYSDQAKEVLARMK